MEDKPNPTVLMLFNDDGAGPLWFLGPVAPETLELSSKTCQELREWSEYHESHMNPEIESDRGDKGWLDREGAELARRVAEELGHEFAVDFLSQSKSTFRSGRGPSRPQAAEAARRFTAQELQSMGTDREGVGAGWFAYAPLSNATFVDGH